jgi:hypothetical protein
VAYQVTHHINVRNPEGDVVTLEPGKDLPKWAVGKLLEPGQPAVLIETEN